MCPLSGALAWVYRSQVRKTIYLLSAHMAWCPIEPGVFVSPSFVSSSCFLDNMRFDHGVAGATLVAAARAASLADVCTVSHVQDSLPANDVIPGIQIDSSSVTASPMYNSSTTAQDFWPDANDFAYCNVTLAYSHSGKSDKVNLNYWLPSPSSFKNRYLATGGGGFAINSGDMSLPGGVT